MLLKGHYQNAYVTHDRQWAMDHVSEKYGLRDWLQFEVEFPVQTPDGEQLQATKVAAAWAGHLQIELIEPVSGYIDPFLPYLPEDKSDPSLRFHHISLRRESIDEIKQEIAQLGLPVVCEGGIPDLIYHYVDTRATLGHYLEYVWASEEGWKMVGWPEGRATI
jgi:hypothetical protein